MMDLLPHWSPSEWISYGVMAAASAGVLMAFAAAIFHWFTGEPSEDDHVPGELGRRR